MIEMLGVALGVPVVLGALTLGMERLERRLDRPVPARRPEPAHAVATRSDVGDAAYGPA